MCAARLRGTPQNKLRARWSGACAVGEAEMLGSTVGNLTVVAINTPQAAYFWRGAQLARVLEFAADVDDDRRRLVFRVADVADAAAEAQYAEMQAAGITIKKVKV
jgi:catechol 2,3-dioxygenase-like lactoylglutathione lyase family enzyme